MQNFENETCRKNLKWTEFWKYFEKVLTGEILEKFEKIFLKFCEIFMKICKLVRAFLENLLGIHAGQFFVQFFKIFNN